MDIFYYLILAHGLLDYPLQGEFLANVKSKNNFILFVHSTIWGLGIAAVFSHFNVTAWWMPFWLVGGHFVIDWLKCHCFIEWCAYMACGDFTFTSVSPQAKKLEVIARARMISPAAVDPLGLPLWIDQWLHMVQIAVCFLAVGGV